MSSPSHKSQILQQGINRRVFVRPGATLVELLLFVTLMAMMAGTIIPLLFNASESRHRQDAIALVEQNGAQILQVLSQEIRSAERIIDPPLGGTGYFLALQTDSGATNPTIFGRDSGALIMVQGRERRLISSSLVGITHFTVDNTSTSADRQSVAVSVGLRRMIRLRQPIVYEGTFDTVVSLYPDDITSGDECNCSAPQCDTGSGMYLWHWCNDGVCIPHMDYECGNEEEE